MRGEFLAHDDVCKWFTIDLLSLFFGRAVVSDTYPLFDHAGYPAGYPAQSYQQNPAYGGQYGGQYYGGRPQKPQQSSGGFLNGCLAALCCCCLADACIDF
jgi:hypothetical protein